MLKTSEIINIKPSGKWFNSGLEYALKSWTSTFNRMQKNNPYTRIQKIIIGIIAEKAVEEYLIDNKIKYECNGKTRWYEEDRYDIGLKELAIDVKANFLDVKSPYIINKISNLFEDKYRWFLKCHALVPMDQFNPGNNTRRAHRRDKLYIFPFIEGFFNVGSGKENLIHTFWDYKWLKKGDYSDSPRLGSLFIRYKGTLNNSSITIYGTTDKKELVVETIKLNEKMVRTKSNFYQVFSLKWNGDNPDGKLVIESPKLKLKEIVKPELSFLLERIDDGYWPIENNWQNLKLHEVQIFILGWVDEETFRVNGNEYPRFTHTIEQYQETKVDNWGCLVKDLLPIAKIKDI